MSVVYKNPFLLGEGAFGKAFRCETPSRGAPFNKTLHPLCVVKRVKETRPEAVREAELLRGCQHPNIVQYLTSFYDTTAGDLCIVMEYCDRGTMTREGGRFP